MAGSWRGQQCVHRVTCSGKLCERQSLCFLKEIPEVSCLESCGKGEKEEAVGVRGKPENDFHVCRLT